MIKEAVVTLAFSATLVEKHPQPDIPHRNYWPIYEPKNSVRVYGYIQTEQVTNNLQYESTAMLVTQ